MGRWFNVSPKLDDPNFMTAWISGVAFYVPTIDLCTAAGDGGNVVPYQFTGRGYVCNSTGTKGTLGSARVDYPYEPSGGSIYHDIAPYANGGPAVVDRVVLYDRGVPLLVPRADVCRI